MKLLIERIHICRTGRENDGCDDDTLLGTPKEHSAHTLSLSIGLRLHLN